MEKNIPAGFHFVPADEEVIHYLNLKKSVEALSSCVPVIELDVYASEPWNIFNIQEYPWEIVNTYDKSDKKSAEYVIYVITPLKMITKNRVSRTAGCGTWKGQTKSTAIKNQNNEVIGFKKMLVFETKKKDTEIEYENSTHWIMHEYSLIKEIVSADDYVLCKIKRVELKKSEKKRKFEDTCGGNIGEAQKIMRSQEEENPNHKSFDAIDVIALPMIHVPDITVPCQVDDDQQQVLQETSESQPSLSDQPKITSNGSLYYGTRCGNLGEVENIMRSQEEENQIQNIFDALPLIHVPDRPPLPNIFDLDGYISDSNMSPLDVNTRSNDSLYDIVNFGSGIENWVDPSTYPVDDDQQQLQEANIESQPSSSLQPKTTSNGSLYYDTCCEYLGEAQKFMKTQEEENPNQRRFDAIDATAFPMIHVQDIPVPLPDDLDGDISALNMSAVDVNTTRSNGSWYDIVNSGIWNWVDPSSYLVDDDQQLQEANESQRLSCDQPKTT